jgi:hypothetical protein
MFCVGCAGKLPAFKATGPSALETTGKPGEDAPHSPEARATREPGLAPVLDSLTFSRRLVIWGVLAAGLFIGWYVVRQVQRADQPVAPIAAAPVPAPALPSGPLIPDVPDLPAVSDSALRAAARTTQPPSAPGAAAAPTSAHNEPVAVVAAFYRALSSGDGRTASSFVVLSKQTHGPLSGPAMSAFYGSLREPLELRSIRQIDAQLVEVRYRYRATRTPCEGRAIVTTQYEREIVKIRSIRADC